MAEELFKKAHHNLQKYWGYEDFRPGQDDAIKSVLKGRDTVVLFPTGGGKSICYQIPATVFPGVTIVISPLVALMHDQVQQLQERGIRATYINSSIHFREVEQRLVNARNGMYDLMYMAPERLKTSIWEAEGPKLSIDLVAVDEAHCISEWGHDFRPAYREIKTLMKPVAEDAAWMALTATATPEVRDDIVESLDFQEPKIISMGFERPNLKWWVIQTPQKDRKLHEIVRKSEGSGLIYGGTRRNCERLAEDLNQEGFQVRAYHAGIEGKERDLIQQKWINDEIPLVVATNAFGMGIDKANCRYVVHYDMPYSLEAYYQEAGRAGRDGRESYPILLYKPADYKQGRSRIIGSYPDQNQLQKVYDALCDSLNLAVGSEMEEPECVKLESIQKRSGLPSKIAVSSMKLLDQLGTIKLVSEVRSSIGIRFAANAEFVREFIKTADNKRKAEFVDTLYRQFGAETHHKKVYLDVSYLEEKMQIRENKLLKGLEVLANEQMLEYDFVGEEPLVRLLDARVSTLPVNKNSLERHRNILLRKLNYMKGYVETRSCRSKYIRTYFGEERVPDHCGNCDNCLHNNKKRESLNKRDIEKIKKIMRDTPRTLKELRQLTKWNSNRLQQILSYLTREGYVESKIKEPDRFYWTGSA